MKNSSQIKLRWALLCHGISIDQKSNNISLFGLIDQLNVNSKAFAEIPQNSEGVRALPVSFELVSLWQRDEMEKELGAEITITLVAPTGKTIKRTVQPLTFPSGKLSNRLIASIPLIGISEVGTYRFVFGMLDKAGKEKIAGEVPLIVSFQE